MKSSDPLFQETQYFRQWWLWLIIVFSIGTAVIMPWVLNDRDDPVWVLVITDVVVLAVSAWFWFFRLTTKVTDEGISCRFGPVIRVGVFHRWEEIASADAGKYNPVRDYGGWGIRYGWKGKAYNVSGNMGLSIVLKNGKRLLIGTQRPDELAAIVRKILKNNKTA